MTGHDPVTRVMTWVMTGVITTLQGIARTLGAQPGFPGRRLRYSASDGRPIPSWLNPSFIVVHAQREKRYVSHASYIDEKMPYVTTHCSIKSEGS